MKNLVFLMLAILLINVSFAGEPGEKNSSDVDCKNTVHKNRDNEKGSEVVIVREDENEEKVQ